MIPGDSFRKDETINTVIEKPVGRILPGFYYFPSNRRQLSHLYGIQPD